jgi:hypothetical protein
LRAARPRISRHPAPRVRSRRCGVDFRRSHDRVSGRAGRRAGALRRRPDLTTLGKIIGGGMPVAPSAAAATSWSASPPWVPSIRRAPCPAIRWP